jgi:hypothetical protein
MMSGNVRLKIRICNTLSQEESLSEILPKLIKLGHPETEITEMRVQVIFIISNISGNIRIQGKNGIFYFYGN